jgi:crotonobetaine/carnitine-CoA ligase
MQRAIVRGEVPDFLQPDNVVIRNILEKNAVEVPEAPFVHFQDGTSWTRLQGLRQSYASANELYRAGVRRGDAVAAAVPNGAAYFRTWCGAAVLGAAIVPVNPGNKGVLVTRMLDIARPKVIVTNDMFRERLGEVGVPATTTIFDPTEIIGSDFTAPRLDAPLMAWDVASLAMTSGTTGPSKVVRISHAHSGNGSWMLYVRWGIGADDVLLCDVPMVHAAGLYGTHAALGHGPTSRATGRSRATHAPRWPSSTAPW